MICAIVRLETLNAYHEICKRACLGNRKLSLIVERTAAMSNVSNSHQKLLQGTLSRADSLIELDELQKAIDELNEVFDIDPNLVKPLLIRALEKLGSKFLLDGDFNSAKKSFEQALNLNPAANVREKISQNLRQIDENLGRVETVSPPQCSNCGKDLEVKWEHCPYCGKTQEIVVERKELPAIVSHVTSKPQKNRKKRQFGLRQTALFVASKKRFLATGYSWWGLGFGIAILLIAVWFFSTEQQRQYNRALENFQNKNYEVAIGQLDKLISSYPESDYSAQAKLLIPEIYYEWGNDLTQQKEYGESISKLQDGLNLSTNSLFNERIIELIVRNYIDLSEISILENDHPKGIEYLEAAKAFLEQKNPNSVIESQINELLVQTYIDLSNNSVSEKEYQKSVEYLEVARVLISSEKSDEIDVEILRIHILWSEEQASDNNFSAATATLKMFLEKYPDNQFIDDINEKMAEYFLSWAVSLDKDNARLAEQKYKIVLEEYPSSSSTKTARQNLLDLYLRFGDEQINIAKATEGDVRVILTRAGKWYKLALELDSRSSYARSQTHFYDELPPRPIIALNGKRINLENAFAGTIKFDCISDITYDNAVAIVDGGELTANLSDIRIEYSYPLANFCDRTLEKAIYTINVDNPKTGFFQITVESDFYKEFPGSTFLYPSFVGSQKFSVTLWIP